MLFLSEQAERSEQNRRVDGDLSHCGIPATSESYLYPFLARKWSTAIYPVVTLNKCSMFLNYVTYLKIRYFLSQGLSISLSTFFRITIYVNSIPIFDSPMGGIWVENVITDSSYINMMNANLWNMHEPKYENIRPAAFCATRLGLKCDKPIFCDDINIWLIPLIDMFVANFTTDKK